MIPSLKTYRKPSAKTALCILDGTVPKDISTALKKAITSVFANGSNPEVRAFHDGIRMTIAVPPPDDDTDATEYYRKAGAQVYKALKGQRVASLRIQGDGPAALALAFGLASSDYRFETYKDKKSDYRLREIAFQKEAVDNRAVSELGALLEAVSYSRDLVNEPANVLTAKELSKRIATAGGKGHYRVEVLGKTKIKSLKMGGLLAVNQGSKADPTFTIMEYKGKKAKNKKPVVLVGKGIVYDSGGMSLKPTANSMDIMKSDMGGAAAVAGAIHAAALAGLPVHLIGLVPATDNCIGPEAYGPGDVIEMFDGTSVEVMNTDAEGRLVLADALAYAKRYAPELVIDVATLTGASMRAVGYQAAAVMGTAAEDTLAEMLNAGDRTFERLVRFPLWKEYEQELDSDIADLRNIGTGPLAGAILAGKFLQRFTDYPWIHIDIAGPSFLPATRDYLPKGGTGFGTALIYQFLKERFQ